MSVGDTIPGARATVDVVRELCLALNAEGVGYCHWKSNAFLDASRSGENDLDILVRRDDAGVFSTIVHRLGFKEARNPRKFLPGVLNYYAYDESAGRFVHLHAHYQLVLGDDLTKNYRIPLEAALLDTAARDGELRVPRPELELILLVIRLALKHATWDSVLLRRSQIPAGARTEYRFLDERADPNVLRRTLEQFLPSIDAGAFAACAGALASEPGAWQRARRSRPLVKALRPYARRRRASDVGLKLWRRASGPIGRLRRRRRSGKQLLAGGRIVAVVGADGAGKSTVVDEVYRWLSRDFAVTVMHLGKPPPSWTTGIVRMLVRGAAVLRAKPAMRSILRAAFAVALARDRAIAATKARAIAANGGIVVCDRYPLAELGLMDGPRVDRIIGGSRASGLGSRLAELERRYYRTIGRPDVLLVLLVDPEVAVARKPEEAADFVRTRWREIWTVDWAAHAAYVLDGEAAPARVLEHAKSIIWSEL